MEHTNAPANTPRNGYDYHNQAWVIDGLYVPCGHPANDIHCTCYGRIHAGEAPAPNADIH